MRPSSAAEGGDTRWGWRRCASEGGYLVLEEFCYRTRTIYPHRRPDRENPAISMSYFCVPRALAAKLGIESDTSAHERRPTETTPGETEKSRGDR